MLIAKIKQNGFIKESQLIDLFNEIRGNGHVLIVKSDGERDENPYTCIISQPNDPSKIVRHDAGTLMDAVYLSVCDYKV